MPKLDVSSGDNSSTLVVRGDGVLVGAGFNAVGELASGASHEPTGNPPLLVQSIVPDVSSVATDFGHTLVLRRDGTVWACGLNDAGQLGDGTRDHHRVTPLPVSGLTDVVAVAAGRHSLAVKRDGSVWAWGDNEAGELGDGTDVDRWTPVPVTGLTDVTAIAARDQHSLALRGDGTVWAWGNNAQGQLGDGTTTVRYAPVQVNGLVDVAAIATSATSSLAVKHDGTVWMWGGGQLMPQQVSGLTGVLAVAAGETHSLALKSDGTVWAWGFNGGGALGNGTRTSSNTPVQTTGLTNVVAIAAGTSVSLATKRDGTVWAWGTNEVGQLGIEPSVWFLSPQLSQLSLRGNCGETLACEGQLCVTRSCSSRGTCSGGTCSCRSGFGGSLCEMCAAGFAGTLCDACALGYFAYPSCRFCDAQATCSAHGRCSTEGLCECDVGYDGPGCVDSTAPSLTLPDNLLVEATDQSGAVVEFTATAADMATGGTAVLCIPSSGSTFGLGTTVVNCSAGDAAGNTAAGSFKVMVRDSAAPVLTLPPVLHATATGAAGAVVAFNVTAKDTVSGLTPVTCTPPSGSEFQVGETTVTCTTEDAAGNRSDGTFAVHVETGTGCGCSSVDGSLLFLALALSGRRARRGG